MNFKITNQKKKNKCDKLGVCILIGQFFWLLLYCGGFWYLQIWYLLDLAVFQRLEICLLLRNFLLSKWPKLIWKHIKSSKNLKLRGTLKFWIYYIPEPVGIKQCDFWLEILTCIGKHYRYIQLDCKSRSEYIHRFYK